MAAGAMPAAASTASDAGSPKPAPPRGYGTAAGPEIGGSLVAHVSDIDSGRIVLMLDDREVVVTDLALTRSLARKAR